MEATRHTAHKKQERLNIEDSDEDFSWICSFALYM